MRRTILKTLIFSDVKFDDPSLHLYPKLVPKNLPNMTSMWDPPQITTMPRPIDINEELVSRLVVILVDSSGNYLNVLNVNYDL